jgi:hypothetical protein
VEVKSLGRPLPNLPNLINISKKGQKEYACNFNIGLYQKFK